MKITLFSLAVSLLMAVAAAPDGRAGSPRRPQDPKPPFPYSSEEVAFTNAGAGITLSGTLTLPAGNGPHPAVILIGGSGPSERDGAAFGHRYFVVLADHLARNGIAVLRYDKRGVGKSGGDRDLTKSTMSDFADDALAGVSYLKGRKEIDPKRIGLNGHSEGGTVAPLAASRSKDVAFLVLAGASVLPADKIILSQVEAIGRANGEDPGHVRTQVAVLRLAFETLRAEKDNARAMSRLVKRVKEQKLNWTEAEVRERLGGFFSPYFRHHLSHDQPATLKRVECPILVVNGGNDLQILEAVNVPPMREALKGRPDATVKVIPGLNHMLQTVADGSPDRYEMIEETISPAALDLISGWIRRHTMK